MLFGDDVVAFENGATIAKGRAEWLKWRARATPAGPGRTIGYSEGYMEGPPSVLIVDMYDTVDRAKVPPTWMVDPSIATRATLYEFGPDHLIHVIRILRTPGFWVTPRR
jgi:hypothetical protein